MWSFIILNDKKAQSVSQILSSTRPVAYSICHNHSNNLQGI